MNEFTKASAEVVFRKSWDELSLETQGKWLECCVIMIKGRIIAIHVEALPTDDAHHA